MLSVHDHKEGRSVILLLIGLTTLYMYNTESFQPLPPVFLTCYIPITDVRAPDIFMLYCKGLNYLIICSKKQGKNKLHYLGCSRTNGTGICSAGICH